MGVYENLLKKKIINENEDGSVSVNHQELDNVFNKPVQQPWQPINDMANSINDLVNQTINEKIKTAPSFVQNIVSPMQNLSIQQKRQIVENETNKAMNEIKNKLNRPLWEKIQDVANDTGKLIELTSLGVSSGNKNMLNYVESSNEQLYSNYKDLKKRQFMTSQNVDILDKSIAKNQNDLLLQMNGMPNNDEKIETNLVKKSIRDSIVEDEQKIQNIQSELSNPISQKLGEIAPSLGQMIPGTVLSTVNPVLGGEYFSTSAGGSYINDALQRGMTEEQAHKYGTIMGTLEGVSEQVITGQKLDRVMKAFSGKGLGNKILNSYGFNILENAVQEAVMEPAQELTAQIIGGEDKANWNGIWERMGNAGFNGGLMGLITNGATFGLEQTGKAYNKIKNGQSLTENEINSVIQENIKARGQEAVENDFKQGANKVFQQVSKIQNKPSNTQEQQITPPVQENASNQNLVTNESNLQGKSFEDIVDESMANYEYDEVKSPLQNRDIKTIGKETKVNAYQYDNPEVKPYFQQMAQMIGEDVGNIASEDNRKTTKGGGTTLNTNISAIEKLHNEMGYSYNQIIDGIVNIIDDHGKENNALSKKLEIIIDDQLRNGYVNSYGKYINPNEEYINLINNSNQNVVANNQQKFEKHTDEQSEVNLPNKENLYETVHVANGKDYQRKEIRSFKDAEGNEFRLYVLPNNHSELTIKEKGQNGHKIIRGSRNEILKEIQKYWKGKGTFIDLPLVSKNTEINKNTRTKETSNEASINLPTKGEEINWNKIERPEGKFRKHYQSIIESSNTTAEAKAIAKELMGADTYVPESNKKLINKADARISNTNPNTELNSLYSRVMNNEKVSDIDIAVGERLIEYYSKIGDKEHLLDAIHATAMAGTQAGRTVQAMALLNHMTPQGQVTWLQRSIDKANTELQDKFKNKKNVPQFELTQDMVDKVLKTNSKEEMFSALDDIYEELGQQVPKTKLEQIDEWRYFSMLANLKTHGRNMIGNTAMHITQRVKDKVAGVIEGTVAKFNPKMERTHTIVPASKEVKQFAKNDVKNIDVQTQMGMNENKYNPQSRLQNSRRTFKSEVMEKTLGKLFDINSTALEVEDNIGLKSMYVKALSDYITANKLDINNMTDAQLSKARQHAIKSAQEATFHQASALATALNQMGKKNNITKFALDATVPFKKTPINVAKAGAQYSPVGLIKSAVYDTAQLRKGNITINQYIDNISKGLTGTGIAFLGYALAEAGILKASGSDDDKKEKYDEQQGKQTYSIEIGGKTYSLDWLSPVGIPLFIGVEANEQFNQAKKEKNTKSSDDDELLSKILKSVANIANATSNAMNPMSEMSMISGLTNVLSSYNKENAVGDMIVNAGKSYVNQFVPTALGQLARTTDDYERTTTSTKTGTLEKAFDSTVNQIKSKIPGLRQTLPVKTDIWGKEVKQSENLPFRAFNNFVNPATVKDVSTDKVDKELNSLYAKTKESSIIPKTIEKTFSINGTDYRMTNDEYAKYSKDFGKTAHNILNSLVDSKEYKEMTDEQKQKAIENTYSYAKEVNKMDYAKKVNEEVKPSTLYNTMKALGNTESQGQYLSYVSKTAGMDKESEKNSVLLDSDFDDTTKAIIYENTTGKDDKVFNIIKTTIKMNQYLDYKIKNSNKEFQADKDKNGNSISGSAKKKIYNYINSNITGYENRLIMLASQYKLSKAEQQKIVDYINKNSKTNEEVIEKLEKFSQNFQVKDGKVYFK